MGNSQSEILKADLQRISSNVDESVRLKNRTALYQSLRMVRDWYYKHGSTKQYRSYLKILITTCSNDEPLYCIVKLQICYASYALADEVGLGVDVHELTEKFKRNSFMLGFIDSNILYGRIKQDAGEYQQAYELFNSTKDMSNDIGDRLLYFESITRLGNLLYYKGDYDSSQKLINSILLEVIEANEIRLLCDMYSILAVIKYRIGDLEISECLYELIASMSKREEYSDLLASSLIGLGMIAEVKLQSRKALDLYNIALSQYRRLVDLEGIGESLGRIGLMAYACGDYDRVDATYLEAIDIQTKRNDIRGLTQVLCSYAKILTDRSAFSDAFKLATKSVQLSRDAGLTERLAASLQVLARVHSCVGNYDYANVCNKQVVTIYEGLNSATGQVTSHIDAGELYLKLNRYEDALTEFTIAKNISTSRAISGFDCDSWIGEALLRLGRVDEASLLLSSFIQKSRENGGTLGLARVLVLFGRSKFLQKQYDEAKQSVISGISISESSGQTEILAIGFRELSEHAVAQGDIASAILLGKRGVTVRQTQRSGTIGLESNLSTMLTLRLAPDYRRLADLLVIDGRLRESENVLALLKLSEIVTVDSQESRRLFSLPRTRSEVDAEKAYQLASAETVALGARLRILELAKQPSKEVLDERADLVKRLEAAEKSFAKEMERIVAEARSGGSSKRAEALQEAGDGISKALLDLPEGTAALSMLWLEDKVRLILTTPSVRVIRTSMIDARTLGKRILAFREVLTDPSKDPVPVARLLYDILWKPVAQDIAKLKIRDVLLSLDGPVRYIPLGSLYDGSGYLAERVRLSLFSPTERDRITQRPSNRWDVLFAGVSNSRTIDDGLGSQVSFSNLPAVRDEARRVRAVLAGGPPPVLDGGFDLQSLRSGLLARPKVVHLASHFLLRSGSESESFLLTGKGDVLRISDSQTLSPSLFRSVELLTLSACQTGMTSETADGREVESIATVFQRKGASAVLSTLWPVADASTAAFMGTFYTLRSQDPRRTKAWCLREAQLRMIRGDVAPPGAPKPGKTRSVTPVKVVSRGLRKDWSHPYHWAPFILQGNPL
jgi:CHAT domain-containing protein